MKKQVHREPTFYIIGNLERADEIRHILEDEWGGKHNDCTYGNTNSAYFVGLFGSVICCSLDNDYFKEAIANGLMKEYKLPEKLQFKPFDKVVVKANEYTWGNTWKPALFGYIEDNACWLQGYGWVGIDKSIILPYNEETAKLIGTNDVWKGSDNDKQRES